MSDKKLVVLGKRVNCPKCGGNGQDIKGGKCVTCLGTGKISVVYQDAQYFNKRGGK